jgi:hypothetical protein
MLLATSERHTLKNSSHLLPGRKGAEDPCSRDRSRSRLGSGGERFSPGEAKDFGGDQNSAEHVAGSDRVDCDYFMWSYAKCIVGRKESGPIGTEGQNDPACALLAKSA